MTKIQSVTAKIHKFIRRKIAAKLLHLPSPEIQTIAQAIPTATTKKRTSRKTYLLFVPLFLGIEVVRLEKTCFRR
jgi:hypothetical protein